MADAMGMPGQVCRFSWEQDGVSWHGSLGHGGHGTDDEWHGRRACAAVRNGANSNFPTMRRQASRLKRIEKPSLLRTHFRMLSTRPADREDMHSSSPSPTNHCAGGPVSREALVDLHWFAQQCGSTSGPPAARTAGRRARGAHAWLPRPALIESRGSTRGGHVRRQASDGVGKSA